MQNNIRYVAVEVGKERWLPRSAEKTFGNGYGDCKDKTTLMRAMLNSLDILALPVLCNSDSYVDTRLPSPFQFNHIIIAISLKDQKIPEKYNNAIINDWLFFDPTNQYVEVGQLPWQLQGNHVIIGGHLLSVLYKLPYPKPEEYSRSFKSEGSIMDDGSFSSNVTIEHKGGWAAYEREYNKTVIEKEQIERWQSFVRNIIVDAELNNFKVKSDSNSFNISFLVKGKEFLHKSGSFTIIKPNIFQKYSDSKLTNKVRKNPIWYGAPQEISYDIKWQLPDYWSIDYKPLEIKKSSRAASIEQQLKKENNLIHLTSRYRKFGKVIEAINYNEAKEFDRVLHRVNSYTLLINTNNEAAK